MILSYSVLELLALFLIYGFLGWCLEVIYAALNTGKFINRGFLNGALCPIYGVGAVIVILALTPVSGNILLLFIGAAVMTSLLELLTGFVLDRLFHTRWWDYSDMPFNLGGYICLKFSLLWGLVCISLMRGIHPVIYAIVHKLLAGNSLIAVIILLCLLALFISDVVVTFVTVSKLSRRIRLMDEIAVRIRDASDSIGEHIYEGVAVAVKKSEEYKQSEAAEKRRQELSKLKERYASLTQERHLLQRRIMRAFPNMRSHKHAEHLDKLKEDIKKH